MPPQAGDGQVTAGVRSKQNDRFGIRQQPPDLTRSGDSGENYRRGARRRRYLASLGRPQWRQNTTAAARAFSDVLSAQASPVRAALRVRNVSLPATSELSEGEVRKIDKEWKKLAITHGALKNLDMPGMTMIFSVKDDAVPDQLQTGEKVRFLAEKIDGKITVTKIEAIR